MSDTKAQSCCGWAPGDYSVYCHKCGEEFVGDKRAVTCKHCALGLAAARIAALEAELGSAQYDKCTAEFQRDEARARIAALTEALSYYASHEPWERFPTTAAVEGTQPIWIDRGYTARAALKGGAE